MYLTGHSKFVSHAYKYKMQWKKLEGRRVNPCSTKSSSFHQSSSSVHQSINVNFAMATLQFVLAEKSKPCLLRKIYPGNPTHRNKRCIINPLKHEWKFCYDHPAICPHWEKQTMSTKKNLSKKISHIEINGAEYSTANSALVQGSS